LIDAVMDKKGMQLLIVENDGSRAEIFNIKFNGN
jgi:hypothetical protein